MVTTYEFLKSVDKNLFLSLVNRGIVSVHIMDYMTIYESYLHELKSNKKSVAITYCADKYNCSEKTIQRIINVMNK